MSEAAATLERQVRVPDVVAQLGISRATAYRMLAEAAGRAAGARGILACPLRLWNRYLEERERWGSNAIETSRAYTRSGASGRRGSTSSRTAGPSGASTPPDAAQSPLPGLRLVESKKPPKIRPSLPRKQRL